MYVKQGVWGGSMVYLRVRNDASHLPSTKTLAKKEEPMIPCIHPKSNPQFLTTLQFYQ